MVCCMTPNLAKCCHTLEIRDTSAPESQTVRIPEVVRLPARCRLGNGINWKSQVFTQMRNWTPVNNMTGVGNALKRHYQARRPHHLCETHLSWI